jgi:hypothetical protein
MEKPSTSSGETPKEADKLPTDVDKEEPTDPFAEMAASLYPDDPEKQRELLESKMISGRERAAEPEETAAVEKKEKVEKKPESLGAAAKALGEMPAERVDKDGKLARLFSTGAKVGAAGAGGLVGFGLAGIIGYTLFTMIGGVLLGTALGIGALMGADKLIKTAQKK